MKKRRLILTFSICGVLIIAAVVAMIFVFRRETTKYSFDKLKCDYISDVAYNDTYIVGKDAGFYLWRDGKTISEKYDSITSVNDYYGEDLSAVLCSKESNQRIYDLYIARSSDSDEYIFINSAEEKYILAGADYSLTEVCMPLLIFTNSSNGCKAVVNLDALNSGLSSFADGYIYPNEFNSGVEICTRPFSEASSFETCDYVIAKQESNGIVRSLVFSSMGKLIVSTDQLELIRVSDDEGNSSVFFCDLSVGSIYSKSGELIASNIQDPQSDIAIYENYAVAFSQIGDKNTYTCFNADKVISVSSDEYDLSSIGFTDGCIYLKDLKQGAYNVVSVFLDGVKKYDRIIDKNGYLLARNQSNSRYIYLNNRGELLFEYTHGDLELHTLLSGDGICVFNEYAQGAPRVESLVFGMPNKDHKKVTLKEGYSFEIAKISQGSENTGYGIFFEKEMSSSGAEYLSVYTPFEKNTLSEKYDRVDIFRSNGILFALGANYSKGYYDIIDLPSNSTVQRIECAGEDFAKLSFEIIDERYLVYDAKKENGRFPIVILSLKKNINDFSDAGSRKMIALYRSSTAVTKGFDYAKLNSFEFEAASDGNFTSFDSQRYLSVKTSSTESLFTVNKDYSLVRVATVYGKIKNVIADCSDPNVKYIISENDKGYLGLYDIDGNQLLSHYYTDIRFVDKDKIGVSRNGAYGVLRYFDGKISQLFDFKYVDMSYFGEGTILLKEASGNSILYRNLRLALDEDVLGGKTLINYVEGQNGYERQAVIILAAEDKLYIDEIEGSAPVELDSFSPQEKTETKVLNDRAKLVYYYKDGELVGKDVVYPTVSFEDQFLNNDSYIFDTKGEGNWYYEYDTSSLGSALAKEDLITSSENFITLYLH